MTALEVCSRYLGGVGLLGGLGVAVGGQASAAALSRGGQRVCVGWQCRACPGPCHSLWNLWGWAGVGVEQLASLWAHSIITLHGIVMAVVGESMTVGVQMLAALHTRNTCETGHRPGMRTAAVLPAAPRLKRVSSGSCGMRNSGVLAVAAAESGP